MATEFKLPELGENIESGDLVRLMIKPGASIAEGEPVMELETDKAVVEVPSSVSGTVGEIRVKEGDKLRVGQVIFTVENGAGTQGCIRKRQIRPRQTSSRTAASRSATNRPPAATPQPERTNSLTGHRQRVQTSRTRRKHRLRRSRALDDLGGRERFRRPAGDGT